MPVAGGGHRRMRVMALGPREVLRAVAMGFRYREALGELLRRRLGWCGPIVLAPGERRRTEEDEGDVAGALHGDAIVAA